MENIGEVALYIKGKVPTTYTVLGLDYGGRGIKGREAYLYSDGIYWVLRLFWLTRSLCVSLFVNCKSKGRPEITNLLSAISYELVCLSPQVLPLAGRSSSAALLLPSALFAFASCLKRSAPCPLPHPISQIPNRCFCPMPYAISRRVEYNFHVTLVARIGHFIVRAPRIQDEER